VSAICLFVCVAVRFAKDLYCNNTVLNLTHIYYKHALVIFNVKMNSSNRILHCLCRIVFHPLDANGLHMYILYLETPGIRIPPFHEREI
jgi:hypothetical protein